MIGLSVTMEVVIKLLNGKCLTAARVFIFTAPPTCLEIEQSWPLVSITYFALRIQIYA